MSNPQKTPEARLSVGRSVASPQPSCQTDISHPLAVDDVRLNAIPDFLLYGISIFRFNQSTKECIILYIVDFRELLLCALYYWHMSVLLASMFYTFLCFMPNSFSEIRVSHPRNPASKSSSC